MVVASACQPSESCGASVAGEPFGAGSDQLSVYTLALVSRRSACGAGAHARTATMESPVATTDRVR